mmetsp:Transcript_19497/g.33097  ORF Transcript_19497/g.33097 Transcript_19497/m.33097 type:complete len:218 (-) Transcript_19497:150-803(-)
MLSRFLVLIAVVLPMTLGLFSGKYADPNHPSCARTILFETETSAKIFGADAAAGEGQPCDGITDVRWGPLPAVVDGFTISADFSSKGGPSDLTGKFNEAKHEIDWEDGNAWEKITSKPAAKSIFNGEYSDPNHPGCERAVLAQTPTVAVINGADAVDGEGATCDGTTDVSWQVPAVLDGNDIVANFSSKGGPSELKGSYNLQKTEIDWEDGNYWPKL